MYLEQSSAKSYLLDTMCVMIANTSFFVRKWIQLLFSGFFPGQFWVRATKEINILNFTEAKDDGVAVAAARPYASHLHLAPDRQPCQHLITVFHTITV